VAARKREKRRKRARHVQAIRLGRSSPTADITTSPRGTGNNSPDSSSSSSSSSSPADNRSNTGGGRGRRGSSPLGCILPAIAAPPPPATLFADICSLDGAEPTVTPPPTPATAAAAAAAATAVAETRAAAATLGLRGEEGDGGDDDDDEGSPTCVQQDAAFVIRSPVAACAAGEAASEATPAPPLEAARGAATAPRTGGGTRRVGAAAAAPSSPSSSSSSSVVVAAAAALPPAVFAEIFREVTRDIEWVSVQRLLRERAVQVDLARQVKAAAAAAAAGGGGSGDQQQQQQQQQQTAALVRKLLETGDLAPSDCAGGSSSSSSRGSADGSVVDAEGVVDAAALRGAAERALARLVADGAAATQRQLLALLDRACSSRGVSREQLERFKRDAPAETRGALDKLQRATEVRETFAMLRPAIAAALAARGLTTGGCLEYLRRARSLRARARDALNEATEQGNSEAAAVKCGAEREALEREFGLCDAEHRPEMLLQCFVLAHAADARFVAQVQKLALGPQQQQQQQPQ
jgi:hypothetical protein